MIVSAAVRMLTVQIILTIPFLQGSNAPLNNIVHSFFISCGYILTLRSMQKLPILISNVSAPITTSPDKPVCFFCEKLSHLTFHEFSTINMFLPYLPFPRLLFSLLFAFLYFQYYNMFFLYPMYLSAIFIEQK